jgi:anti-sigma factor RsiW
MSCPLEFDCSAELIVGYGARTLDPDATAAFENHIRFCDDCRQAAALQAAVWTALDEWPHTPVPPDFDQRFFQRIAQEKNRGRWLWRVLLPAAACIALASLLLLPHPKPVPGPPIEQVEHALDDIDLLSQVDPTI